MGVGSAWGLGASVQADCGSPARTHTTLHAGSEAEADMSQWAERKLESQGERGIGTSGICRLASEKSGSSLG